MTIIFCLSKSIKKVNKLVNVDLNHAVNWLYTNKSSLSANKTDMVIFKPQHLKIKLCGNRVFPTEIVTYLGVKIDTNLSWQYHVDNLSINLNRANVLLFKMRKYVSLKILRSFYFAIFDSYLSYCCIVGGQNSSNLQRIIILQKKLNLEFIY